MKTHAEMGQLDGGFTKALEDLGQARALNKKLAEALKAAQGAIACREHNAQYVVDEALAAYNATKDLKE